MAHIPERETVGSPHQAPRAAAAHEPSLRTYYMVFFWLMVLLVLTVGVAVLPTPPFLTITIALAIASLKAAMVIYYFMHVREASTLTKVFVLASFLWLGIMFVLTFSDYLSRGTLPVSRGWVENTDARPGVPVRIPVDGR